MPRIFKGGSYTLKLLLPCLSDGEVNIDSVVLYTDPEGTGTVFSNDIVINGNIIELEVFPWVFNSYIEGVISYRVKGTVNGNPFYAERQSDYFLKTPADFIPAEIPETIEKLSKELLITTNGTETFTSKEGTAWDIVTITTEVESLYYSISEAILAIDNSAENKVNAIVSGYIDVNSIDYDKDWKYASFIIKEDYHSIVLENIPFKEEYYFIKEKPEYEIKITVNGTLSKVNGVPKMISPTVVEQFGLYKEGMTLMPTDKDFIDNTLTIVPEKWMDGFRSILVSGEVLRKEWTQEGRVEQKSQLASINIRQNGTYTREDGYNSITVDVPDLNGSFEEGYNKGMEDAAESAAEMVAETAQELEITENGIYLTKYADDIIIYPEITGVFDDGTYFYDWGEIKNGGYDTKISPTANSRVEFWWKAAETSNGSQYQTVFGCGYKDGGKPTFDLKYDGSKRDSLELRIGNKYNTFTFDNTIWNHFLIDNGTMWLNGVELFTLDLSTYVSDGSSILINLVQGRLDVNANGLFGMFKIDDNIFIPKDGGFINYQTNEPLELLENKSYIYGVDENISGYFEDGTPFHGYAQLKDIWFSTDISPNPSQRLEIWFKDLGIRTETYATIIAGGNDADFQIRFSSGNVFWAEYCKNRISSNRLIKNEWNHMIMSYEDGFIINGEKIGDFASTSFISNLPFYINTPSYGVGVRYANNIFGMIKIDDHIFIPTESGFINYQTNSPLESNLAPYDTYTYIENLPTSIEKKGNLIKSATVNVPPRINVRQQELKFAYSDFEYLPEWIVWDGINNMSRMFSNCSRLASIPMIDTSNVTDMNNMFNYCGSLKEVPLLDTSKVTNMNSMFSYCSSLKEVPLLDTSNVTDMNSMFKFCNSLKTIPQFNTKNVTNMNYMLDCSSFESIPALNATRLTDNRLFGSSDLTKLVYFGGLIGLSIDFNSNYVFNRCPNLSYESCINILNGLYDFRGNGDTITTRTLKVHKNFLTLVGDEISIGTDKGWIITA